jgi:hypothetical protein
MRPSIRPPLSSYASTIDNQAIGPATGNFARHENATRRTPYSATAVNSIGLEPEAFHIRPRCKTRVTLGSAPSGRLRSTNVRIIAGKRSLASAAHSSLSAVICDQLTHQPAYPVPACTAADRVGLQLRVLGTRSSSRIRPANDRETSRNDGKGRSVESTGQEPDSAIAAGSEIGPENTLKVETRVQIPLGLQQRPRSDPLSSLNGESARPFVPHLSRGRRDTSRTCRGLDPVVSTDTSLGDAAPSGS